MKNRKKEKATNDKVNLQADTLTDLPVTDEQADDTRGGRGDNSDYLIWQRQLGTGL
ncbi:MAG TPA: hypothetical protein VLM38_14060 [Blastocatellia bacterium]|nr:hypothetical protein [Blastocatellia bacterium]